MAEDSPPISTEVPETVTIDTGADTKTVGDLNKEFADFWTAEDTKAEAPTDAPAAPETGAAQETKETKAAPEPKEAKLEPKPEPKAETPKTFSDEEVDQLALPPRAADRPELQATFKQLKEFWKADRTRLKSIEQASAKLEAELSQAKANAWTQEQKADYEHAASVRRRFDFVSDPEFLGRFHAPVLNRFQAVLDEAVQALPDRGAAQAWANHIKENYQPDQLNREWWLNSVIAKVPNELERQSLLGSVTELFKLQKERDTEIQRRTADKSAFDAWINEKTNFTAQRVKEEIMTEIGEQEKRIQEVLPRDPEQAKTPEERAAIETHNARFHELNKYFQDTMQDLSKNGPRAWVRAAVEATRTKIMNEQILNLEKELKSTKNERDQFKTELDKIHGARRKLANTTGTPPTPSDSKPQSLSIKSLDVRKAFSDFNWDDTQRR